MCYYSDWGKGRRKFVATFECSSLSPAQCRLLLRLLFVFLFSFLFVFFFFLSSLPPAPPPLRPSLPARRLPSPSPQVSSCFASPPLPPSPPPPCPLPPSPPPPPSSPPTPSHTHTCTHAHHARTHISMYRVALGIFRKHTQQRRGDKHKLIPTDASQLVVGSARLSGLLIHVSGSS